MRRTGTMTILFSDVVGSTDLLSRLGDREWNDLRRRHFSVLRSALEEHDGSEIKNTGDGLMAVFASAVSAVECAIAMQQQQLHVVVDGSPLGVRIGIATGEATEDHGDWFGTPVVEAARLCALAGTNEAWATALVEALAGSQADARFVGLGPQSLKGFDRPVEAVRLEPAVDPRSSMYAQVEHHPEVATRLVAQLDYWESLPSLQHMRAEAMRALAPLPGHVICDIGCGAGSELIRIARAVGPDGAAIGVDPSITMLDEARRRAELEHVVVELHDHDGRDTGLPAGHCDAVRIERVVQHVGDLDAFLAEAKRITRPGGRIVVADTDWGSLMLYPGDRDVIRRLKASFEQGPIAEPWAGRVLHGSMLDAGLTEVTSDMHQIQADAGVTTRLSPMFDRFVEARLLSRSEIDAFTAGFDAASEQGGAVAVFTMFVASGRVPGG